MKRQSVAFIVVATHRIYNSLAS